MFRKEPFKSLLFLNQFLFLKKALPIVFQTSITHIDNVFTINTVNMHAKWLFFTSLLGGSNLTVRKYSVCVNFMRRRLCKYVYKCYAKNLDVFFKPCYRQWTSLNNFQIYIVDTDFASTCRTTVIS